MGISAFLSLVSDLPSQQRRVVLFGDSSSLPAALVRYYWMRFYGHGFRGALWGPVGQKGAGPSENMAKTPSPVALYRSIPLTGSLSRADLGRQISVDFAVHPGFLAPCPKLPYVPGPSKEEKKPPSLLASG